MKKSYIIIAVLSITVFLILSREEETKIQLVEIPPDTNTFPEEQVTEKTAEFDLDSIIQRGKLVALTRYNSNSFFLYRGQPMGYEYELLKLFTEEIGVDLEIKIPSTRDSLFVMLNNGEGDLIAANMTITLDRSKKVNFSKHHNTTRQMLVQKKPSNWRKVRQHVTEKKMIRDPLELLGKMISVRKGSNYHQRINNLKSEMGGEIYIDTVPDSYETDQLIKMVNDNVIKYTIADENIAAINAGFYPNVDMKTPISFSQRISWAFRKTSPDLLGAANDWMIKLKAGNSPTFHVIYNKYYKNRSRFKKQKKSQFYSLETGTISSYDEFFKMYENPPMFPWTLLASQAYQESRFDPQTTSWAGAEGLMQLLPKTAKDMGITDSKDPEQGVIAGTKYLAYLYKHYWSHLPDHEAVKFVLASYNAGAGHIRDAQRLASFLGLDSTKWDDHVEVAILKLSDEKYFYNPVVKHGFCRGQEPYDYVREIFERQVIYDGILMQAKLQKEQDSLRMLQYEDSIKAVEDSLNSLVDSSTVAIKE